MEVLLAIRRINIPALHHLVNPAAESFVSCRNRAALSFQRGEPHRSVGLTLRCIWAICGLLSSPTHRRAEKQYCKYHNTDFVHNTSGPTQKARAATLPWALKVPQGKPLSRQISPRRGLLSWMMKGAHETYLSSMVQEADALVSATIKRLAEIFADERQKLEQQWDRSENVPTEDLRVALQRYRSFFARLLAI
jgi:hypothetical protein